MRRSRRRSCSTCWRTRVSRAAAALLVDRGVSTGAARSWSKRVTATPRRRSRWRAGRAELAELVSPGGRRTDWCDHYEHWEVGRSDIDLKAGLNSDDGEGYDRGPLPGAEEPGVALPGAALRSRGGRLWSWVRIDTVAADRPVHFHQISAQGAGKAGAAVTTSRLSS